MSDARPAAYAAAFTDFHLLNTAIASAPERILLRGGTGRRMRVPVTVALLLHPEHGWGLFDTGSAPRINEASARWPFRIYRYVVPSSPDDVQAVVDQLPRFAVTAADVRWIVVSHFHPDHVAGLHDFPHARLITTRVAYDYARSLAGWRALRRGVLPDLLPGDFAARATLVTEFGATDLNALGPTHDLFGDGSGLLVPLPGHARG